MKLIGINRKKLKRCISHENGGVMGGGREGEADTGNAPLNLFGNFLRRPKGR